MASSFSLASLAASSRSLRASNLNRFLGARWRGEDEVLLFSLEGGDEGEEGDEGDEGDGERDSEL